MKIPTLVKKCGLVVGLIIASLSIGLYCWAGSTPRVISAHSQASAVVGGSPVSVAYYPWVGSLQLKGFHECGGVLVKDDIIITAAHCNKDRLDNWRLVIPDPNSPKDNFKKPTSHRIISRINHPWYNPATFAYDVSIWRAEKRVISRQFVSFDKQDDSLRNPKSLFEIVGWGFTSKQPESLPPSGETASVLQSVTIPLVNETICKDANPKLDFKSQFCAGPQNGNKDSCVGDSGGPLFSNSNKIPVLVGIVSSGKGCGLPDHYGAYTRASVIFKFILAYSEIISDKEATSKVTTNYTRPITYDKSESKKTKTNKN